jgi:hypothetical protein
MRKTCSGCKTKECRKCEDGKLRETGLRNLYGDLETDGEQTDGYRLECDNRAHALIDLAIMENLGVAG